MIKFDGHIRTSTAQEIDDSLKRRRFVSNMMEDPDWFLTSKYAARCTNSAKSSTLFNAL